MKRARRVGAVSLVSTLIMACGESAGPSVGSLRGLSSLFHDGAWVLTVDRALRSGVLAGHTPGAALAESDYEPVAVGRSYEFNVTAAGGRVVVSAPALVASLEEAGAEELRYGVVSGAFAGGRIVVWREASGLQGELTIYGSGVPVVQSERGLIREAR
jgi:hypothetical protein